MSHSRSRCRHESRILRTARTAVALFTLVAVIATAAATPALAYWTSAGSGVGASTTGTLSPPTNVTVPATAAPNVQVSWTAGTGGVAPTGYFVIRRTGATVVAACGSTPAALINATNCSDTAVPDGTFTYTVTAVFRSWTAPSSASSTVTVENATAVNFVVDPSNILAGTPITPAIKVALQTADGGAYTSSGVPVTLAIANNPGTGSITGTTTVNTDANGVATFSDISITGAGVGYTLRATSPGLTADISAPFTVTAPFLGAAASFSILGVTAVVNTGTSSVSGDVGVSPAGTISGFADGSIGGDIHLNDATAAAAQSARGAAYADLKGRAADAQIVGDLGGRTLLPGVYHSTAALALTGVLILDGNGNTNATFVFQSDAAFNVAAASTVSLINGAQAANVFWVALGAAGTGANSSISGTIISAGAITLGADSTLIGRALSAGTVTMASNTVRFTSALPPTITITGGAAATTKDTTPAISGTSNAAVSSPVVVSIAGQTLRTTVVTGGTWSVTAALLPAGSYQVVARVRDAAGNGTATSQTLTVEVNPAPVDLGTAASYAVLATAITNTGTTVVNGDAGVSPAGLVTGLAPADVNGTLHVNDAAAATAQSDLTTVINEVSARTKHTEIAGDLGGQTFHLGIHHQTAALALTGTVTLDAEGNSAAIFIFQTDAAFNTAASAGVNLINGAQAANVYWVVTGAAGTGANTVLAGTILARGAITLGASTVLNGRALTLNPATLAGNTITRPGFVGFAGRAQAMESTDGTDSSGEAAGAILAPEAETQNVPTDETTAPSAPTAPAAPSSSPASMSSPAISTETSLPPSASAPPQPAAQPSTTASKTSSTVSPTPTPSSGTLQTTELTTETTTKGSSTAAVPTP